MAAEEDFPKAVPWTQDVSWILSHISEIKGVIYDERDIYIYIYTHIHMDVTEDWEIQSIL